MSRDEGHRTKGALSPGTFRRLRLSASEDFQEPRPGAYARTVEETHGDRSTVPHWNPLEGVELRNEGVFRPIGKSAPLLLEFDHPLLHSSEGLFVGLTPR